MPNKDGHRQFGNIRRLPSGRQQARYPGPDGLMRTAPNTFATVRDARAWLAVVQAEIIKGDWVAPEAGEIKLVEYGQRWIAERKLRHRTRLVYVSAWQRHIVPYLGHLTLSEIKPATVRAWRTSLIKAGCSEGMAARSYRILRAIFNTAIKQDDLLVKNPCRIKGYDAWDVAERPSATVVQVDQLVNLVPDRYRAMIVAAAFMGLRWSELVSTRRTDFDPARRTLRVVTSKTAAGYRTVAMPREVQTALTTHLAKYTEPHANALIFTGPKGGLLVPSNWSREVKWHALLEQCGFPEGFHFHDLRHTANNIASATGASTRELMHRMGHSTVRAALIYQRANSARDQEIAAAIDARIEFQRAPEHTAADNERTDPSSERS